MGRRGGNRKIGRKSEVRHPASEEKLSTAWLARGFGFANKNGRTFNGLRGTPLNGKQGNFGLRTRGVGKGDTPRHHIEEKKEGGVRCRRRGGIRHEKHATSGGGRDGKRPVGVESLSYCPSCPEEDDQEKSKWDNVGRGLD